MTYKLKLIIPGLPTMANLKSGRSHWRYAHQETTKWKSVVIRMLTNIERPATPLESYRLSLTRFSSVEPDYDGLVRGFKPFVDALKDAGITKNDRLSNTGAWSCSWEKCKPKQGCIHITVEENEAQGAAG